MSAIDVSALKLYSVGRVAENKPLSTDEVPVVPIEILGLLDGEIADRKFELIHKGVDDLGRNYEVKVNSYSAIICKWLPLGSSNRATAPDVRRGERVTILRYANSNLFFWTTLGLDDFLRRLETSIWLFSDIPDGTSNEIPNVNNSYSFEVSTHKGLITIRTSKRNQEPYLYTMQFNCKVGCFTVTDDVNNFIELDSAETKITLHNADGTYLSCDKRDIIGYAPRDMKFSVDRDFLLDVGRNMEVNVVGDVSYKCSEFILSASTKATVTAPLITLNGKLSATGAASFGSTMSVAGNSTFAAPMSASGITSSATISGPRGSI